MTWFGKITANPDNYELILEAYEYFEKELEDARKEVNIRGSLEKASASLPGIVEYRYSQLQEVEAILEHLNIKFHKLKNTKFRGFLEHYNKSLSSRDAEKFAESDEEVVTLTELINSVAFIRNKYLGIMKGLDNKSFQINNITRLRCAGLEDAEISYGYKR
jgi:DNA-directed RNA polymerase subunit F